MTAVSFDWIQETLCCFHGREAAFAPHRQLLSGPEHHTGRMREVMDLAPDLTFAYLDFVAEAQSHQIRTLMQYRRRARGAGGQLARGGLLRSSWWGS